jgi:hypothetical protein
MSIIHGPTPLASGMDVAVQAIRASQARFSLGAQLANREVSRSEPAAAKDSQKPRPPSMTPPNPGPPGGADPGDLAQAMIEQNLAGHDLAANVKMVQAFDAMLAELSRLGKTQKG